MAVEVIRHATGDSFLARSEPWLLENEAENNLVLGLARQISLYTNAHGGVPYLATIESGGSVVGCAFRTPPWKLILTSMPAEAIHAVAADVAQFYDRLPAVLGPNTVAREFGRVWSQWRSCSARDGMKQRLYRLDRVIPPERPAPGMMRFATTQDLPLIDRWLAAFVDEAVPERIDVRSIAAERVSRREMALWLDGEPRCMAGYSGRSPNGVRVGYVYTPPRWRRRGYASACVAALSQAALDEGARICFLYTDLANQTSNGIYQQLGYEPVTDAMDIHFDYDG